MSFEELRSWAVSEWSRLREEGEVPYVLVGAATCGRAAGALATLEAMEREAERQGVEVHFMQTGCMGACSLEPIVVIGKPDMPLICYPRVTEEVGEGRIPAIGLCQVPSWLAKSDDLAACSEYACCSGSGCDDGLK